MIPNWDTDTITGPPLQNSPREYLPDASYFGLTIGIVLCCAATYFELNFRHSVTGMPVGATIRPMGLGLIEGMLILGGLFAGVPFSVLGIILARSEGMRNSVWLGVAGLILNLLPLPVMKLLFAQTLSATGIRLAP